MIYSYLVNTPSIVADDSREKSFALPSPFPNGGRYIATVRRLSEYVPHAYFIHSLLCLVGFINKELGRLKSVFWVLKIGKSIYSQ